MDSNELRRKAIQSVQEYLADRDDYNWPDEIIVGEIVEQAGQYGLPCFWIEATNPHSQQTVTCGAFGYYEGVSPNDFVYYQVEEEADHLPQIIPTDQLSLW